MLEKYVENKLLAEVGDVQLTEDIPVPASDHSTEMAELAEAIGHLAGRIAFGKAMGEDVAKLERTKEDNERKLAEVATLPKKKAHTITEDTGETWAEHYHNLEPSERNPFLRKRAVRVEAARRANGKIQFKLTAAKVKGAPDP